MQEYHVFWSSGEWNLKPFTESDHQIMTTIKDVW